MMLFEMKECIYRLQSHVYPLELFNVYRRLEIKRRRKKPSLRALIFKYVFRQIVGIA